MDAVSKRLYESYASTHAGHGNGAAVRLVYRRDIRPHLPAHPHEKRVLDLGCGQGELVALLRDDGYDATGVDVSPEQVAIARQAGRPGIVHADFHEYLRESRGWHAIVATDVLEHLPKHEVIRTFDDVRAALAPGGVFIARVPNAASPFSGHIRYGDITHETSFTARTVAQLAAVSRFESVRTFGCPPLVHGLRSAARAMVWKPISGLIRLALAAETGALGGHITTQNLTFIARAAARAGASAGASIPVDGESYAEPDQTNEWAT